MTLPSNGLMGGQRFLNHLSDTKLRQFRQLVEQRYHIRGDAHRRADLKTLYTLICFEVMRRRENAVKEKKVRAGRNASKTASQLLK